MRNEDVSIQDNSFIVMVYEDTAILLQRKINVIGGDKPAAKTKWTPFYRRHFETHFHEWICLNFEYNFTEVCSYGLIWEVSIGSDNG